MALVKGTNSYVTVAEASAYFEDRIDVAAWTSAEDAEKSKALVTASAMLNDLRWIGVAISESQTLAFPRTGTYFDPRLGCDITLSDTTPTRIINATYELAYHLLNNDGLLDDVGTVTDLSVASINLHIRSDSNKIPSFVRNMIKPLLINAGSNAWWRAN
jgi:hypothetical protein